MISCEATITSNSSSDSWRDLATCGGRARLVAVDDLLLVAYPPQSPIRLAAPEHTLSLTVLSLSRLLTSPHHPPPRALHRYPCRSFPQFTCSCTDFLSFRRLCTIFSLSLLCV